MNMNTEGVAAHTGCQPVWRALCIGPLVRGVPWQDNRFEYPIARPPPILFGTPRLRGVQRQDTGVNALCPATASDLCVVEGGS